MSLKCPVDQYAPMRREIARRIEAMRKEAIELSLQTMAVESSSASVFLTSAARELGSALQRLETP
jgi:hypothetical protein